MRCFILTPTLLYMLDCSVRTTPQPSPSPFWNLTLFHSISHLQDIVIILLLNTTCCFYYQLFLLTSVDKNNCFLLQSKCTRFTICVYYKVFILPFVPITLVHVPFVEHRLISFGLPFNVMFMFIESHPRCILLDRYQMAVIVRILTQCIAITL